MRLLTKDEIDSEKHWGRISTGCCSNRSLCNASRVESSRANINFTKIFDLQYAQIQNLSLMSAMALDRVLVINTSAEITTMMSRQKKVQSKLFYTAINLERRVRKDHLLRKVKRHIDFDFIYNEVKDTYGYNGHESVPPPVILKMMLLLVLYNRGSGHKTEMAIFTNSCKQSF